MNGGEYLKMIGRMNIYRFAELVSRYQDPDNDTYRHFFLRLDPRLAISQMILWALSAWVAMLMVLQAIVFQAFGLPRALSMFLAILAVFMGFLERKLDKMTESPEILVWASIMLKTFKGWFTVTVFIVNETPNDFYIGTFFLFTALLGSLFFYFDNV